MPDGLAGGCGFDSENKSVVSNTAIEFLLCHRGYRKVYIDNGSEWRKKTDMIITQLAPQFPRSRRLKRDFPARQQKNGRTYIKITKLLKSIPTYIFLHI